MRENLSYKKEILLRMREFTSRGLSAIAKRATVESNSIETKFNKAEFKNFMTLENYK